MTGKLKEIVLMKFAMEKLCEYFEHCGLYGVSMYVS